MKIFTVRIPHFVCQDLFKHLSPHHEIFSVLENTPPEPLSFPHTVVSYKIGDPVRISEEIRALLFKFRPSVAIVWTPLLWYSEAAAAAIRASGVNLIWGEIFMDGKIVLDRQGCQYTRSNDLQTYLPSWTSTAIDPPRTTRIQQIPDQPPESLYAILGPPDRTIVVFGQVPQDRALMDNLGRTPYLRWLDTLFSENPQTRFAFKHHPLTPTSFLYGRRRNVSTTDASIWSLFRAYRAFAAWSSTVIMEGIMAGVSFVTEGHHFLDDPRLVLRVSPGRAGRLLPRIASFAPDPLLLQRTLSFVTTRYALHPSDPLFPQRLLLPSDEFFSLNSVARMQDRG
jgi:hypothetical protein